MFLKVINEGTNEKISQMQVWMSELGHLQGF